MDVLAPLRSVNRELDRLVEATPGSRDRVVDFLRAAAIIIVVVWHWALSVVHRGPDAVLVMPNPIAEVPLGWLPTWLLQVMPVFFLVGGFANLAGWRSTRRRGGGARAFYARRARRLLAPVAAFLAIWTAFEVAALVLVADYRGVLVYGDITFIPLWFVAAYLWVILLVPITARLHELGRELTVVALGAAVAVADVGRFALGIDVLAWANTALVWVFVHQLGYFYADGTLPAWPTRRRVALVLGALTALAALTSLDVYPRSLVAHPEVEISHLYPTTAVVAVLALFQLGVVLLARPALASWLRRPAAWKPVVAVNAVIVTIFVWHMTALLLAVGVVEGLGFELPSEPTASWWAQRPLWIVLPGSFLGVLLAAFHRVEVGTRRPSTGGSSRR